MSRKSHSNLIYVCNITLPCLMMRIVLCFQLTPCILSLNFSDMSLGKGLVNMSANCSLVSMSRTSMLCCLIYSTKCQYVMFVCFVLGQNLGVLASSKAPLLSSKTLQCILGWHNSIRTPLSHNSVINHIKGMVYKSPLLNAIKCLSCA